MEKGEAEFWFRVPVLAVEVSCPSSSDEATWQEIFSNSELKKGYLSGSNRSIVLFIPSPRFLFSSICLTWTMLAVLRNSRCKSPLLMA